MADDLKRLPGSFGRIAVAVAFSPRVEAILAEARRLKDIFGARMFFIHVGKKNLQEEQYLRQLIHRFGLDGNQSEIIWREGDPVEEILTVCEEQQIDLLVAGALEKESLLKYFLGSVARMLCRKAKCSILMLREPSIHSKPVRNIVVEGSDHPKTGTTIETGLYIARQCKADKLTIIQEDDAKKLALMRSTELSDEEVEEHREKITQADRDRIKQILGPHDNGSVQVTIDRLEGKPGFVISKYARETHADLLLLNSPDTKLGLIDRVFQHDIEFALADLPCDLIIVHSQRNEQGANEAHP